MEDNLPRLSLVLPMYRVERFIVGCLESIYSQKEAESVEVILVDDGSPDSSAEVAEQWLNNQPYENWRIIQQENRGLGGARNTGLCNASASYVWFVDSDDRISSDALSHIFKHLDEGLDYIAFNSLWMPQNKTLFACNHVGPVSGSAMALNLPIICSCFNIYSVDFLLRNELYFKEKFLHEDNEMALRVNFYAKRVSYYPEVIYIYQTDNQGSISNTISMKHIKDRFAYLDSYYKLLESNEGNVSEDQLRAMQKGVSYIALALFSGASRLNTCDFKEFRKILKSQRTGLNNAMKTLPFVTRNILYILSYLPYRGIYKRFFGLLQSVRRNKI